MPYPENDVENKINSVILTFTDARYPHTLICSLFFRQTGAIDFRARRLLAGARYTCPIAVVGYDFPVSIVRIGKGWFNLIQLVSFW